MSYGQTIAAPSETWTPLAEKSHSILVDDMTLFLTSASISIYVNTYNKP